MNKIQSRASRPGRSGNEPGVARLRRSLVPLAIGLFASLSMVAGGAQLPPKQRPVAVAHGGIVQIKPSAAAQMAVLSQIKASKTATQKKIDSRLLLGVMKARGDTRMAALPNFRFVKPESDGRLPVQLIVKKKDGVQAVLEKLNALDAVTVSQKRTAYASRTINARVRMQDLESLAAMNQVLRVRQAIPAFTHAGAADHPPLKNAGLRAGSRGLLGPLANALNISESVQTHGANLARGYGGTGVGRKVCVLSDGVENLAASQASGDLPDVDVLPGQEGTGDEGTAMLEIVHDMAPNATLGFASAFNGEDSFAQNILDLAADGCNIIVDDVIYLDESPWQDGPVAQSVNTVTAAGVLYFSSAGNEGNVTDGTSGTWEGDFLASEAVPPTGLVGAGALHDFGDGGQSISIEASSSAAVMIWAESYDLTTGSASTDYDLYDMSDDLATIFDASTETQDGVGGDDFPVEFIGGVFSGERLVVAKFADGTTSSVPAFNLIAFRGEFDDALATSGATRGHSAAAESYSTAATPAAAAFDGVSGDGPFPNLFTAANTSESFTSDGPRRILLDPAGVELTPGNRTYTGGVVRQKPDITAADGVSTAAPGFSTFYGTSAAAPNGAAIAALLQSGVPGITPVQVRSFLTGSAIDIEAAGVDNSTGVGIVMPTPALQAAGATPIPFLTAGTAVVTQIAGDGDTNIEPNEIWSVSLPVTNEGAAVATPVSATVSTTATNVTLLNATSAYPSIAVGATASNTTAFRFRVEPGFVCGSPINFTATANYNGGNSPLTASLPNSTGGAGAAVSASYTGAPVPIPDGGAGAPGANADATVTVAGVAGAIRDVEVSIDGATCSNVAGVTTVGIDHTFVSDLDVRLISPSGTVVTLASGAGGSGNNFCQTAFDDQSAGGSIQNVVSSQAPFTGSFTPASPLSAFNAGVGNGTWTLEAQDFFSLDTGSIRAFTVSVTPAVCDAPALAAPPSVSSIVRTDASPTKATSVGFTVTFSEAVSGVDAADFALTTTDKQTGATIASVSGSGAVYTVTVNTVKGKGTIRLDVVDNDSIASVANTQPLGDIGTGNGNFNTGEVYTIKKRGGGAAGGLLLAGFGLAALLRRRRSQLKLN